MLFEAEFDTVKRVTTLFANFKGECLLHMTLEGFRQPPAFTAWKIYYTF